ncbi:MAG: HAMP domain-containing protein [Calditrichaeota bacterium]|nr:HAMP domain-containing protein [Calditrichota bacterium]MCB9391797.1 HAMP domain-containing protein [Calditrichota bacterium]
MPRTKPLFRKLFLPYVAVSIATAGLLLAVIGVTYSRFARSVQRDALIQKTNLVAESLFKEVGSEPLAISDSLLKRYASAGFFRLTLTDSAGNVLAESDTLVTVVPNLQNAPEVVAAKRGTPGMATRRDAQFQRTFSFVALPVVRDQKVIAILRAGELVSASRWAFFFETAGLAAVSLILVGIGIIVILRVVRQVVTPLDSLRASAEHFAQGKLETKLEEPEITELASLARALNRMAELLSSRIADIERRREEQEAVLFSMLEGVVAVDCDARVIMINSAASRLFDVKAERARGRLIEEAVRITDIQDFVHLTLAAGEPVEREIIRHDTLDHILQLRGTPIVVAGQVIGGVVVINDITQMRRLEATRREFVSNASHELKTPVTAIKGSIETLREGALDNPADAERFLEIIARQADFLQAIIEDLLSLARIEQATEHQNLAVEKVNIAGLLRDAIEATSLVAESRGQKIEVSVPADLTAPINNFLIRQAVINLLDNACKYSPEGTEIKLRAKSEDQKLVISVQDEGPGISEKHLPRIFERFYRVEASRNRKFGGTGLGLAIVKHAALAHGGTADVDTQLGRGSTFSIRVPLER